MKAAQTNMRTSPAIDVGDFIRAPSRRDVNLNDNQLRLIVEAQPLDVLVCEGHFIVVAEICRQRCQPQGREQRVLHGAEQWTGGFRQSGKDHLYSHRWHYMQRTL